MELIGMLNLPFFTHLGKWSKKFLSSSSMAVSSSLIAFCRESSVFSDDSTIFFIVLFRREQEKPILIAVSILSPVSTHIFIPACEFVVVESVSVRGMLRVRVSGVCDVVVRWWTCLEKCGNSIWDSLLKLSDKINCMRGYCGSGWRGESVPYLLWQWRLATWGPFQFLQPQRPTGKQIKELNSYWVPLCMKPTYRFFSAVDLNRSVVVPFAPIKVHVIIDLFHGKT